jgi:hypothetical protein
MSVRAINARRPDPALLRDLARQTPDWRWQLVKEQRRHPWSLAIQDPWLKCARRYVLALRQGGNGQAIAQRFPGLHRAWKIWASDGWDRVFLEARILAGGKQQEIAARCGIGAKAVQAFETVFFDVRDRLWASDWILCFAFGMHNRLCEPRPLQQVVKNISYASGPLATEIVIAVASKMIGQPTPIEIPASTEFRCRRLIELLVEPLNEKTSAKYLRMHARMLTAEARMNMRPEELFKNASTSMAANTADSFVTQSLANIRDQVSAEAVQAGHPMRNVA